MNQTINSGHKSVFRRVLLTLLVFFGIVFHIYPQAFWRVCDSLPIAEQGRRQVVSFSIGSKGYILTGNGSSSAVLKELWEWDSATTAWSRKADFPISGRNNAVGFSIGAKGYIGTGDTTNGGAAAKDFYEWDQATDTWTRKADFGGAARYQAVGFSIGTKGYIGTGVNSSGRKGDFWEWDQATNIWSMKDSIISAGGTQRNSAVGFSIGTKGYIGTGFDGVRLNDFYEWDQATNVWSAKANFPGEARQVALGFSIKSTAIGIGAIAKGYIGAGDGATGALSDFYEWDQATDVWTAKDPYLGGQRRAATGFSIGNCGYVGMGRNGSGFRSKSFYRYCPDFELPITLLSFTGQLLDGIVQLKWVTASEINNDYFTVEKCDDRIHFKDVLKVNGAGNSSAKLHYAATDEDITTDVSYYRLRQTDFDGTTTYSGVIAIGNNSSSRENMIIYPNPASGENKINLNITTINNKPILVVIRDMLGQEFYSKVELLDNVSALIVLDPDGKLCSGVYLVTASCENKIYKRKLVIR
ncbi:MAG: T9SS type A sorting domain-containing protein [Bacteroidetes bacterium]|nr:T9SS type A sorting domain-containing protein [Bacteroidota bacterium]